MIMSHTLTKVLSVGDLRVALNDDGELEISTKRGVVVTLNDVPDLEALAELVRDARIACGDPLVGNPQVGLRIPAPSDSLAGPNFPAAPPLKAKAG